MAEVKNSSAKKAFKASPKINVRKEKKVNKEIYWILIVMIIIIALIAMIPYISKWFNTFKYDGLTFTKERFGQITVYHYYYYFKDRTNQIYQINLFLRGDPRQNNVSAQGDIIYPPKNSTVYLTYNATGLIGCSNILRDSATLSSFLSNNQYRVRTGVLDSQEAIANNLTYVTCNNRPDNMVIKIFRGNTTQIIKDNDQCYNLEIADCQGILDGVEKFEVQSIVDAKKASVISTFSQ